MDTYAQGFVDKCAEYGVDADAVVKVALNLRPWVRDANEQPDPDLAPETKGLGYMFRDMNPGYKGDSSVLPYVTASGSRINYKEPPLLALGEVGTASADKPSSEEFAKFKYDTRRNSRNHAAKTPPPVKHAQAAPPVSDEAFAAMKQRYYQRRMAETPGSPNQFIPPPLEGSKPKPIKNTPMLKQTIERVKEEVARPAGTYDGKGNYQPGQTPEEPAKNAQMQGQGMDDMLVGALNHPMVRPYARQQIVDKSTKLLALLKQLGILKEPGTY